MKKERSLIYFVVTIGNWIYQLFMLQTMFLVYTIMGVVIFGFFPALISSTQIMYKWMFLKYDDLSVKKEFHEFYKKYFWESNKIGWLMAAAAMILYVDIRVSSIYLQSIIVHSILIFFIILYLVLLSYIFTVFVRYDLKLFQYIRQSFFIALTSPIQTIAIFVGVVVVYYLFMSIPFLYMFFGVPILLTPIIWFSSQGVKKAEEERSRIEK